MLFYMVKGTLQIQFRILRWKIILDYPCVPDRITKVLTWRWQKGQPDRGQCAHFPGKGTQQELEISAWNSLRHASQHPHWSQEAFFNLLALGLRGNTVETQKRRQNIRERKWEQEPRQNLFHSASLGRALVHHLVPQLHYILLASSPRVILSRLCLQGAEYVICYFKGPPMHLPDPLC